MTAREFRRKDLKEDEFVSTTTRATRWLMQRRRRIGWALLGVVVIGSLIAGVRVYQERREDQAAAELAAAMEIYRSPVVAEETPADAPSPGVEAGAEGVVEDGEASTPPGEGADPAAAEEGGGSPSEGTIPPAAGTTPLAEGATPPAEETVATAEGNNGEPPAQQARQGPAAGAPGAGPAPPAAGPDSTTAMADEHAATGHRHFASEEARYRAAREALLPVAEEYGDTASGKVASFYLAICEAELGNVDAAVQRFEAAADGSQQLVAAMALYRLGSLHLDQGDPEAAAGRFERLVSMSGEFFPREEALMARGRANEAAGDLRAALAAYQQVVSEHGESFSASSARERVEELSSRLGLDPDVEG